MIKPLLIIPILLVLLVSGCTQGPAKDPVKILEQSIENIKKTGGFSAVYEMKTSMSQLGKSVLMSGDLEFKQKSNKLATNLIGVADLDGVKQNFEMSMFILENGIFMCANLASLGGGFGAESQPGLPSDLNKPVCLDFSSLFGAGGELPNQEFNFESVIEQQLMSVKSGATKATYIGSETIAGRQCDNIKLEQDLGGGLKIATDQCIDTVSGFPLRQKTENAGALSETVIKTISGSPQDSDFELPYPIFDFSNLLLNEGVVPTNEAQ